MELPTTYYPLSLLTEGDDGDSLTARPSRHKAHRDPNHPGGRLSPEKRLACPACSGRETRIVETRGTQTSRRRRYKCAACGFIFSTIEKPVRLRQGCGLTAEEQVAAQERKTFLADLSLDDLLNEIRRRAEKSSLQEPYKWPNP